MYAIFVGDPATGWSTRSKGDRSGRWQWNPVGDGFRIDTEVNGFADKGEALRALAETGRPEAFVASLPVQVRRRPPSGGISRDHYDPTLTRVR
jgi:hypothetical protein